MRIVLYAPSIIVYKDAFFLIFRDVTDDPKSFASAYEKVVTFIDSSADQHKVLMRILLQLNVARAVRLVVPNIRAIVHASCQWKFYRRR